MIDPRRVEFSRRLSALPPPVPVGEPREESTFAAEPVEARRELERAIATLAGRVEEIARREASVAAREGALAVERERRNRQRGEHGLEAKRLEHERRAFPDARARWEAEIAAASGVVEGALEQAQEHEERRQHHEGAWRRLERDEAILYERRAELERLRNSLPLVPET